MSPRRQPYESDALKFPLLQAISAPGDEGCYALTSKDIDALGVEIERAYKRCSVPESRVSIEEREVNEVMLGCIGTVDARLQAISDTSSEAGATFMLYRRVILTPTNVSALFRMTDPKVRTGSARCHAIWHLHKLRQNKFSWSICLEDGTSFAMGLIKAMAESLDPNVQVEHMNACRGTARCSKMAWTTMAEALGVCKYPPEQVVHALLDYDWPTILQPPDVLRTKEHDLLDSTTFYLLHKWCVGVFAMDSYNEVAKDVESLYRRDLAPSLVAFSLPGYCSKEITNQSVG
jgi:hypothetical protein